MPEASGHTDLTRFGYCNPKGFPKPAQLQLLLELSSKDVSPGVLISKNVCALQEVLWETTKQFASNPPYERKMTLLLTPLFNACMRRLDPTFKAVSSLSGLDERDSNTAGYTFCHVAAVYQLYMQDPTIVEESNDERLCRSKLLSKLLAEIFLEGLSAYKGDTKAMPSDVFGWLDRVTSGSQEAMLDFCSQWVQTCPHMLQQNESGCHPFKLVFNSSASVQAVCDLTEQVAHLHPELIQGTEKLFQLGLLFNRAEVEHFQQKQKDAAMRLPVKLPSICSLSDSSDDDGPDTSG